MKLTEEEIKKRLQNIRRMLAMTDFLNKKRIEMIIQNLDDFIKEFE